MTKTIWHIDREGWECGIIEETGELFIGTDREMEYRKDTEENRKRLVEEWKANSFSKEVKR